MKLKTDWNLYVQHLRKKEIDIIQPFLSERHIKNCLEIGAGNGYQSRLLSKYVEHLCCTELNAKRLIRQEGVNICYKICDAEKINEYFEVDSFDFIFSSNLLEHIPNPQLAISGSRMILKDNGIMIHIIPSPFNAIVRILLWYFDLLITVISKGTKVVVKQKENKAIPDAKGNNLKTKYSSRSKIRRLIVPRPHGVSNNVINEIIDMRKRRWVDKFEKENFKIIQIIKGPVASGYGFGFDTIRGFCEKIGLTSEYIYIIKKDF